MNKIYINDFKINVMSYDEVEYTYRGRTCLSYIINNEYILKRENKINFNCKECGKEVTANFDPKRYLKENFICGTCLSKKTNIKKYGVESSNKSDFVKQKIKKTKLEKYGDENYNNSSKMKETKKKNDSYIKAIRSCKKTKLEKYGDENYNNKQKIKKTKFEKYGDENYNNKQKIKKTCIERYGVVNGGGSKSAIDKILQKRREKMMDKIYNSNIYEAIPLFKKEEYIKTKNKYNWKCKNCNTIFEDDLYSGRPPRCPKCYPINNSFSGIEKELIDFLSFLNVKNIIENDRDILSGKELDIYLTDYNLAIEFNGLYWHSDIYKHPKYHLEKTIKCESKGIQLIHIFEDEWLYKQDIVKARLKNILGKNSRRIGARQTIIKEISPKEKNLFLNTYHIQGEDKSRIKLGAYYQDELVGVMTFSKPRIFMGKKYQEGYWELSRFATISDTYTPGLASKMLKHFERGYEPKNIESFADRRWSQGNLYKQIGFELVGETSPNYWYVLDKSRKHRYNYRKSELKKFENYHPDKTEKQIMDEAGYLRIYDCGNLKFIKHIYYK